MGWRLTHKRSVGCTNLKLIILMKHAENEVGCKTKPPVSDRTVNLSGLLMRTPRTSDPELKGTAS